MTPTCSINGIVCDTSSGWGLAEWKQMLDPLLADPLLVEPEEAEELAPEEPMLLGGLSRTRSFGGLSVEASADEQVKMLFSPEVR
eukprot:COSAG01_NODE_5688_length_4100_cov_84.811797_7_plen_85_part_00